MAAFRTVAKVIAGELRLGPGDVEETMEDLVGRSWPMDGGPEVFVKVSFFGSG